jgi:hypothetical protein
MDSKAGKEHGYLLESKYAIMLFALLAVFNYFIHCSRLAWVRLGALFP